MSEICLIQGEAKTVRFTLQTTTNQQSTPVDITGATFTWVVERDEGVVLFQKDNADFTIVDGPGGIATVDLDENDTNQDPETYDAELKTVLAGGSIDKNNQTVSIERTLT